MFTGVVEATGIVETCRFLPGRRSLALSVRVPKFSRSLKIGGSLAVNGVCLTVIKKKGASVSFQVIGETLRRSELGHLKNGDLVNLERPMKMNGRLEGHIVLGHVDAVGTVRRVIEKRDQKDIFVSFPKKLKPAILEKGSIAIDGVSLTIGKVTAHGFWIHLIPHTLKATNLKSCHRGSRVNLETDILVKLATKPKVH